LEVRETTVDNLHHVLRCSGRGARGSNHRARLWNTKSQAGRLWFRLRTSAPVAEAPMHIRCPHCKNPIELVDFPPPGEISCAACGYSFHLDSLSTTAWDEFTGKRFGKFEVLGTLGHGAFGTVLKARDSELDRTVALKIPRPSNVGHGPQDLDRFLREAR